MRSTWPGLFTEVHAAASLVPPGGVWVQGSVDAWFLVCDGFLKGLYFYKGDQYAGVLQQSAWFF